MSIQDVSFDLDAYFEGNGDVSFEQAGQLWKEFQSWAFALEETESIKQEHVPFTKRISIKDGKTLQFNVEQVVLHRPYVKSMIDEKGVFGVYLTSNGNYVVFHQEILGADEHSFPIKKEMVSMVRPEKIMTASKRKGVKKAFQGDPRQEVKKEIQTNTYTHIKPLSLLDGASDEVATAMLDHMELISKTVTD